MKNILKIVATLFLLLVAIAIAMQGVTAIYNFPSNTPLTGKYIYNPYQSIDSATFGSSFRHAAYTPGYEHNFNLTGLSIQCFGVEAPALWLDYALMLMPLSNHQSQYLVDRLSKKSKLIGINRPSELSYGVDSDIFGTLTGYDLFDVDHTGNGAWDVGLSSGHYSTLGGERVMILGDNTPQNTLKALRQGHSYIIRNGDEPHIQRINVDRDTIEIRLQVDADSIILLGDRGAVRQKTNNSDTARYVLTPEDSYIRAQIHLPGGVVVWLNPIARTSVDGMMPVKTPVAHINTWFTTLNSIAWGVATIFILWLIVRLWRGKKQSNNNSRRRHNRRRNLYAPLQYIK